MEYESVEGFRGMTQAQTHWRPLWLTAAAARAGQNDAPPHDAAQRVALREDHLARGSAVRCGGGAGRASGVEERVSERLGDHIEAWRPLEAACGRSALGATVTDSLCAAGHACLPIAT